MIIKNSSNIVTIEGYTSEGSGVAHLDGKVVFIKGALKGERCEIKILKAKKNIAYAKVERLLEPSPHRLAPACPHFGKCGGCDLMHMDYEEELLMKKQRVEDAFKRIGGLDIGVSEIVGSEAQTNYRNKAIYSLSSVDGHAATGFYRERSHDVIPIEHCLIQAAFSDEAALAVRNWMNQHAVTAYDETRNKGAIRNVFCRYGFATKQAQVTIVSAEKNLPHINELITEIVKHCPETVSIVLNINKTQGNTVLDGKFMTIWGNDYMEDILCNLRFKLSPRSFYQINRDQAEKLYYKALEYAGLTGKETVLELYCGTGTITLCLAGNARQVIGAEIVEAAILDARENARLNGISNVEFICTDAADASKKLLQEGLRPDVVVVDPPRKGLAPDVIVTINDLSPDRVVYISCDPGTLARDLKLFEDLGYKTQNATAFDMFPRCTHVESIILMTKCGLEVK